MSPGPNTSTTAACPETPPSSRVYSQSPPNIERTCFLFFHSLHPSSLLLSRGAITSRFFVALPRLRRHQSKPGTAALPYSFESFHHGRKEVVFALFHKLGPLGSTCHASKQLIASFNQRAISSRECAGSLSRPWQAPESPAKPPTSALRTIPRSLTTYPT
jgi:hypothetical protein